MQLTLLDAQDTSARINGVPARQVEGQISSGSTLLLNHVK
jgi:hypothetical protein